MSASVSSVCSPGTETEQVDNFASHPQLAHPTTEPSNLHIRPTYKYFVESSCCQINSCYVQGRSASHKHPKAQSDSLTQLEDAFIVALTAKM
jgi:hypothetical protein